VIQNKQQVKEKVIDLLKRVTRVSVETMKTVEAMKAEKR
jgi:predicted translin family RNA/ssDNA-binding protein